MKSLGRVRLFATPWTAAYQAPSSMGFSRQEYWSGLPLPSPNTVLECGKCWINMQGRELESARGWGATFYHRNKVSVEGSVRFSSVTQSCPILCDPMNHSTPGLPVHHHLPEFTQTHVHQVSDAIQPSHPLSSPSPPAPNASQHQSFPMSQLFA